MSYLSALVVDGIAAVSIAVTVTASILLALVCLIDRLLARQGKTLQRSAAWYACLVALLLLPCLVTIAPPIYAPTFITPLAVDEAAANQSGREYTGQQAPQRSTPQPIASSPTLGKPRLSSQLRWRTLIVGVYFAGLGVCLVRLALGVAAVVRLRSRSLPMDSGPWQDRLDVWADRILGSPVCVRHSAQIEVPLVVGFRHPVILIPSRIATGEFSAHIDSVLCHELAHIGRADHRWLVLLRVVRSLYWFHPLMWYAERRIADIRERACDEYCVHVGNSDRYVETLLELASSMARPAQWSVGLAAVRTPRIARRLKDIRQTRGVSTFIIGRASRSGWTCGLVLLGLLLIGCRPSQSTIDQGSTEELARAVEDLRDQMSSLGEEISAYRDAQGPSAADIPYLEQLVSASELTYELIHSKFESGAAGGEAEELAAARLHLHIAKAQLALARDDSAEAIKQYEQAVQAAEEKVESVQAAFDAGTAPLELVLQAQVERAQTKAELSKLARR